MIERHISVIGTRCVCFTHEVIPLTGQRWALFCPGHLSIAVQPLRFWWYFMSPNCDWPHLLVASFHLSEEGCRSFLLSGASRPVGVAVCWPPPSRDGEGHVSSSSSPWVAWLSAYLHLSAGASFSFHPTPSSFSVSLLNIPHSAPFTALKQNSSIVYQHWLGKTLLSSLVHVILSEWVYDRKWWSYELS